MQRLLCHRVAQYYGLDTSTIDEGEDQGKILARRTLVTGIPVVRLDPIAFEVKLDTVTQACSLLPRNSWLIVQVRLADVKLADSRDQRRVETPPRVLMKNCAAADRAARAAAAAANGEGAGQANNRSYL